MSAAAQDQLLQLEPFILHYSTLSGVDPARVLELPSMREAAVFRAQQRLAPSNVLYEVSSTINLSAALQGFEPAFTNIIGCLGQAFCQYFLLAKASDLCSAVSQPFCR
jgi:hypothetical protein